MTSVYDGISKNGTAYATKRARSQIPIAIVSLSSVNVLVSFVMKRRFVLDTD